jgi:hypothetical protein
MELNIKLSTDLANEILRVLAEVPSHVGANAFLAFKQAGEAALKEAQTVKPESPEPSE